MIKILIISYLMNPSLFVNAKYSKSLQHQLTIYVLKLFHICF